MLVPMSRVIDRIEFPSQSKRRMSLRFSIDMTLAIAKFPLLWPVARIGLPEQFGDQPDCLPRRRLASSAGFVFTVIIYTHNKSFGQVAIRP